MTQPVTLGLVGLGRWGRIYLKTLLGMGERCRLTHVCTRKPENLGQAPYAVTVVSDWRDLMKSDCQAVILAVPPAAQPEILEAALAAGKPAIVEKPLSLDLQIAERLHQRAEESRTPVLVDHIHLFNPWYQALRRSIEASKERIHAVLSEGMNLGPFREHTPALWDWAPHDLGICMDLFGRSPDTLDALGGPLDPAGLPETVAIRLDYPEGASAWIQAGSLASEKRRQLSVFTDSHWYRLDDLAEEKVAVFSWSFPQRYRQAPPDPTPIRRLKPVSDLTPLQSAVTYFLDGLAGGDRRYFGTGMALEVVRQIDRIQSLLARRVRA